MLLHCIAVCDGCIMHTLVVSATCNVINYLKVCEGLFLKKSCTHLRTQSFQPLPPTPAGIQSCNNVWQICLHNPAGKVGLKRPQPTFHISACLTLLHILLEYTRHVYHYYYLSIGYHCSSDMAFVIWTKRWMGVFWPWVNNGVPFRGVDKILLKGPKVFLVTVD